MACVCGHGRWVVGRLLGRGFSVHPTMPQMVYGQPQATRQAGTSKAHDDVHEPHAHMGRGGGKGEGGVGLEEKLGEGGGRLVWWWWQEGANRPPQVGGGEGGREVGKRTDTHGKKTAGGWGQEGLVGELGNIAGKWEHMGCYGRW